MRSIHQWPWSATSGWWSTLNCGCASTICHERRINICFRLGLPGRASVSAAMHTSLQWLTSYPQRVTYKLCLLINKCLQGWAPAPLQTFRSFPPPFSRNCRWQPASGAQNADSYIWSPSVLHIWTRCLEHSVVWAASFICVFGLFQTFTQDFSVQFVIDLVFLSSRAPVWGFSLAVHFLNVSLLLPRCIECTAV